MHHDFTISQNHVLIKCGKINNALENAVSKSDDWYFSKQIQIFQYKFIKITGNLFLH